MKQIQKLRQQCGISQATLAKMLGVDSSTVAKWETGESYPRTQLLPKIAKIFKCSIDELFLLSNDSITNKKEGMK